MTESERALQSVRCERHGLRYDPRAHDGCAACRRESGAAAGRAAAEVDRTPAQRSLVGALVVTAILLLLTTAGLTLLHETVAQQLRARIPGLQRETPPESPLTPAQ
jgi:hypothetical protein